MFSKLTPLAETNIPPLLCANAAGRLLHSDSRQIKQGDIFVACQGEYTDGRSYIPAAIANGAAFVFWDDDGKFAWNPEWKVPNQGIKDLKHRAGMLAAQVYGNVSDGLKVWGVTGTNGKTTTTGMLAAIMAADEQRSGQRAQAVGNIGVSSFDALAAEPRVDILVAELSSFQLHWSSHLRPEVGALLNLADDHLDWHGSFEAYAADKAKILRGQHAVYGKEDEHVRVLAASLPGATAFSHAEPAAGEVGVSTGSLLVNEVAGMKSAVVDDVTTIQPAGLAGVLDAAAASAVAALAGAQPESIAEGLSAYVVAGHRGEIVHRHAGVTYIDNSKATNPHAAEVAMRGLDSVVWVAGGQLKGADVSELLRTHAARLKAAVLVGVDKHVLAQALVKAAPHVPVFIVDSHDPEAAMEQAVSAAVQHADAGDTVLLAPAAASLDMYTGMGQRGDIFAAAARRLAR